MPGYIGKATNRPEDTIGQIAEGERNAMWGPIPGEVLDYDAASGTATVRPLYKWTGPDGQAIDLPDLFEVPVDQPRTGNAGLTFPVPAGTRVMLTPQMRATEAYEGGSDATATDARAFHLSTMRASLAGGDSLSSALPGADGDNTHLRFSTSGEFGIKGSPDGKIQMTGAEGDIIDLLAEVCETLGVLTTTVSSGSSAGTWPITQQAALAALAARLRAMVL
ncbi:hypothetical protein JET14_13215 [Martelella lutilitoris]|uniref:Phage protein Gp138 N-terminal domain-containing protein n=1 Tax=Martelella lutilitoris TaxID=2583532 RepID=A0A7T7HHL4_9HYPH|nr:Gp138 family membrane-puncturing spike protein [Martelella lutilitoris]QQM29287.1 hypothetical protein JET14_13215 [Martelella lutilitoris]